MKTQNCAISTCKHCGCFQSEGRRGGLCGQFGTFTDPNWSACPLVTPVFGEVWSESSNVVLLEKSFSLKLAKKKSAPAIATPTASYTQAV